MFRDHRVVRHWLPNILLVNRFEDPSFRLITDYEEDVDVTTTSIAGGRMSAEDLVIWREGDIKFRGGGNRRDHAVFLGWNIEEQEKLAAEAVEASFDTDPDPAPEPEDSETLPPATYTISIPDSIPQDWQLGRNSILVLNVAQATESPKPKDYSIDEENEEENTEENAEEEQTESEDQTEQGNQETGEEEGQENEEGDTEEDAEEEDDEEEDLGPLDFTVELVTRRGIAAGVQVSRFGTIPPPLKAQVGRSSLIGGRGSPSSEPVMQTIEIPLSAFIEAESNFVPVDLAEIRLVFDQGDKGVVILDRIGFAQGN